MFQSSLCGALFGLLSTVFLIALILFLVDFSEATLVSDLSLFLEVLCCFFFGVFLVSSGFFSSFCLPGTLCSSGFLVSSDFPGFFLVSYLDLEFYLHP
ncbi:Protein of unknown function [Lactobacillus helveticus CIRM-BIA 101]|nr:Protein of unknown function [Lactobacillus helveticus CIRM-BIA 103]CDI65627.1 Protein of unknown function [Lactobacillus helveticus CIRM-BIA 101]